MTELIDAAVELRARIDAATVVAQVTVDDRLDDLSDDKLAAVTAVCPKWQPAQRALVGDIVQYDNTLYRCVQAHSTQADWTPPVVPALWTLVRQPTPTGPAAWVQPTGSSDAYGIGDLVTFEGAVWESTITGNVWSPTAYPQGWKKL